MWEQNDIGGATGTALVNNIKNDGPLFRASSAIAAQVTPADTLLTRLAGREPRHGQPDAGVPGHGADPGRQHQRGHRRLPGAAAARRRPPRVPPAIVDCFSEFLPTADWVGVLGNTDRTLNFRLTARDASWAAAGSAARRRKLHAGAVRGPVPRDLEAIPQNVYGTSPQTVTWAVAGPTRRRSTSPT